MIPGLETLYGVQEWATQYAHEPIQIDPWGGKDGHSFVAAFEGVMEIRAAQALYDVILKEASLCANNGNSFAMVETGTSDGFTATVLAHAIRTAKANGKIWTGEINLLRSDKQPRPWPKLWQQYGLDSYIVSCVGDTRVESTWSAVYPPLPVELDALLIDSEHTEETVMAEFELLGRKVKKGGLILFHDVLLTHEYPGVARAVDQISEILNSEPQFLDSCRGLALLKV